MNDIYVTVILRGEIEVSGQGHTAFSSAIEARKAFLALHLTKEPSLLRKRPHSMTLVLNGEAVLRKHCSSFDKVWREFRYDLPRQHSKAPEPLE